MYLNNFISPAHKRRAESLVLSSITRLKIMFARSSKTISPSSVLNIFRYADIARGRLGLLDPGLSQLNILLFIIFSVFFF